MDNKELPEPLVNVMVTYKKDIIVCKKGWYNEIDNTFVMPFEWQPWMFNGKSEDMPHGFGGDRRKPSDIIKWEPI